MKVTLKVVKGEDLGDVFHLREGEAKVFGRGSKSDVVLRDVTVSRRHARVRYEGGVCYVQDLESRNGTKINGRKITEETALADRERIEIGQLYMEVRILPETSEMPFEAPPLASSVHAPMAPAVASRLALKHEPADLIGSVIGGCCIERYLGGEGPVHVYRAIQVSMERTVALKLLLPKEAAEDRVREWFLAAARIGGRLSHPNIIQVYDAGEEQGVHFVALEYVGNATLRDYLGRDGREKPLDQFLAAKIAEQIAAALDSAHSQGIVHGRVTPEHILLTTHGMPKLADLGVAALSQGAEGAPRTFTLDELSHIAPEQADGVAPPNPLSDLYSLGAVLFTMLAGRPAFAGASAEEVMEKLRKGEREALPKLRRDVVRVLAQIAARAMSPKPEERFAHASEMRAALLKAQERL
jgi:serine/threonine-protein kinase